MTRSTLRSLAPRILGSAGLLAALAGAAYGLWRYKQHARAAAQQQAAAMPEPAESAAAVQVVTRPYRRLSTAIGTVQSLQSISLRNELPGTVRQVALSTGRIVEQNELLVEFDVSVEQAQLAAQRAEAKLAESMFGRMERASASQGASAADVDRARAERDKALADVQRLEALIERKRLRAPFRARVGFVDLHLGQYLDPGTRITTLQGLAESVHVDFSVTQQIASRLRPATTVELEPIGDSPVPHTVNARVIALDAQVDRTTRNMRIRAELGGIDPLPQPGSSMRVRIPIGEEQAVPVVPVSALRRDPAGNFVFVLTPDDAGKLRAHVRPVQNGPTLGDEVVITAGLEPGETVAAAGSFKLREGVLVIAMPTPSAAPPSASSTTDEPAPAAAGNHQKDD